MVSFMLRPLVAGEDLLEQMDTRMDGPLEPVWM
jgi:hypothetical protein